MLGSDTTSFEEEEEDVQTQTHAQMCDRAHGQMRRAVYSCGMWPVALNAFAALADRARGAGGGDRKMGKEEWDGSPEEATSYGRLYARSRRGPMPIIMHTQILFSFIPSFTQNTSICILFL